ncbi:hypothetical protein TNCV_743521 [Trichonephila clavipes]|nr:hypothetical protein TNCV_743521 [Trichonephila clavipes]
MIQVEISRRPSYRELPTVDFVITEMAAEHLFHTKGDKWRRTNLRQQEILQSERHLLMTMALSFILEIALHLMHWAFYFASAHDMPSLFDILIFEVGMEIMKNFYFNHHCSFQTGTEKPLPLDITVEAIDSTAIPQVRSSIVFAICRALDLKAELVPFQDTNEEPRTTKPKKAQCNSTPSDVYSFNVFKICEALELKANLRPLNERPVFKKKITRPVPSVHSIAVFHMCQALKLDVELAKT